MIIASLSAQTGLNTGWEFAEDDIKDNLEDMILGSINKKLDIACCIQFVRFRKTITSELRQMKALMGDGYPRIEVSVGGGIKIGLETPLIVVYMYVIQNVKN